MAAFIFAMVCLVVTFVAVVLKVTSIEKSAKADEEWLEKFEKM